MASLPRKVLRGRFSGFNESHAQYVYSLEFEGLDAPENGIRKLLKLTEEYLA